MLPKFVIFMVISALFVGSIYSMSSSIVFGSTTKCSNEGKNTFCTVVDSDSAGNVHTTVWKCAKNPDGKTYHCEEFYPTSPPPELNTAINDAMVKTKTGAVGGGAATGDNNTHVPNGNIVKSGGTLKNGDITDGSDSSRNGNPNCMQNCTLQ